MKFRALVAASFMLATISNAQAADTTAPFRGYVEVVHMSDHVDVHADATYVESIDYTFKLLDRSATDAVRTQTIDYSTSLSDVKIDSAYTLKANGVRIPVPKENYQIDSAIGKGGAKPLISDITSEQIIFPNLEVGDSIHLSYRLLQQQIPFPGQFSLSRYVTPNAEVDATEISVTAPKSLPIKVEARDLEGGEKPTIDGSRSWSWKYSHREAPHVASTWSVSPSDFAPGVVVSTFKTYGDVAIAYENRERPQLVITPRIVALANRISAHAANQRDTVRALYEWVSGEIRYEYNLIGIGMVVPHDLNHILDNRTGDCKDHVLLLQALLAAKHIASSAVLLNAEPAYRLPNLPDAAAFDHVIAYIPSLDLYLDPTADPLPLGTLPSADSGKPNVHTADFHGITYTPTTDTSTNWAKTVAETTFHQDGSADGDIHTSLSGVAASGFRRLFQALAASPYKDTFIQHLLESSGLHGSGKYTFDGPLDKVSSTFQFELKFHIDNAEDFSSNGAMSFTPPVHAQDVPISSLASTALVERPEHSFPCSGGSSSVTVIDHLPLSVHVLPLPKDVHLSSVSGVYDSEYQLVGTTVTSKRSMVDMTKPNVCTPEYFDSEKAQDTLIWKDLRKMFYFQ